VPWSWGLPQTINRPIGQYQSGTRATPGQRPRARYGGRVRLLLIRHGQTPSNVAGALDTAPPGAGLTPLGEAQARAVPAALRDEPVAAVHASPLLRTQLTARPLAADRGLEVQVRAGLEEISAGDLEMRTEPEARQAYAHGVAAWLRGDLDRRLAGGETGHGFRARYDAAVRGIAQDAAPDQTVVVVSHGAAIRAYAALAAGLDPEVSTELGIANTGMAVLDGHPDTGWVLTRWRSEPLGGAHLEDHRAQDVTGESTDEVDEHHG
jgi:broad specificity phosphatase PhoE